MSMKKYKVIVLLMIVMSGLLFNSSVIAEDTQYVEIGADKIKLGMTKQEVIEATNGAMNEVKDNYTWVSVVWFTTFEKYDYDGTDMIPGKFGYLTTSFAGYDKCRMFFSFDSNDILTSVIIITGGMGDSRVRVNRDGALDMFNKLKNALSNKYGESISNDGKFIEFTTDNYDALQAINSYYFTANNTFSLSGKYGYNRRDILNTSQFLVNQGNSYVDIKLIEFYKQSYVVTYFDKVEPVTYGDDYGCILSYSLCSTNSVENVFEDAQNRMDSLNSDI